MAQYKVLGLEGFDKKEVKEIFTYEVRPFSHIRAVNDALKRGIKVKFLLSQKPKNMKNVKEDIKAGVDVRYYPVDELRFVIKDNQESNGSPLYSL